MSRAGKHPVSIPAGVTVSYTDNKVAVKGPKGLIERLVHNEVVLEITDKELIVKPKNADNTLSRALWGTTRRTIANMVKGVTEGFVKTLDIIGVGYKAGLSNDGKILRLTLGFSHDILYIPEDGIKIDCPKPTQITITGIDNQKVGQTAAEIRAFKKPEPFKGKGIKYSYEEVRRKEGKKK